MITYTCTLNFDFHPNVATPILFGLTMEIITAISGMPKRGARSHPCEVKEIEIDYQKSINGY